MKSRLKAAKKSAAEKETAYVTKRVLVRAASPAVKRASRRAMEVAGYVVKAENGWVVRVDQDGTKSRITKIRNITRPSQIALD
ncbi:hypothetical protein [uncultured Pontibacter sp.]|uniref:hypothetical protein n=1 Tax=uncultured Pontibacter sp. TaxID=453356 RepID=UPI00261FB523|nr:hypothetical protein [uncultured Pontibacter sp.]